MTAAPPIYMITVMMYSPKYSFMLIKTFFSHKKLNVHSVGGNTVNITYTVICPYFDSKNFILMIQITENSRLACVFGKLFCTSVCNLMG